MTGSFIDRLLNERQSALSWLLSQSFFKRGCDVDAVLQSDWLHPDLAVRNQN